MLEKTVIRNFTPGLNTKIDPVLLKPNVATIAQDVDLDNGSIRLSRGRDLVKATAEKLEYHYWTRGPVDGWSFVKTGTALCARIAASNEVTIMYWDVIPAIASTYISFVQLGTGDYVARLHHEYHPASSGSTITASYHHVGDGSGVYRSKAVTVPYLGYPGTMTFIPCHVAMVIGGTERGKIYLNGNLVAYQSSWSAVDIGPVGTDRLSMQFDTGMGGRGFACFSRALTAREIWQLAHEVKILENTTALEFFYPMNETGTSIVDTGPYALDGTLSGNSLDRLYDKELDTVNMRGLFEYKQNV